MSDDADLSALRLSGVTLSPAFASAKSIYTGRAAYGTVETTVTATADIGAEMITIEPAEAQDDDTPGHQVSLLPGQVRDIMVTVVAENGNSRDPAAYMVSVYRENLVKSDDASLDTGG